LAPGGNVIKTFLTFRNKLECLYLTSFYSLFLKTLLLITKILNYGHEKFYNIGTRSKRPE